MRHWNGGSFEGPLVELVASVGMSWHLLQHLILDD
jgi:hypothetical protein